MLFVENDEGLAEKRRSGMAQLLRDAVQRWARAPAGRFALLLRLGALDPPPAPHQRRVALLLLHEAAERHGGQVFPLANGDLVLLSRASHHAPAVVPARLAATLLRLFGVGTSDSPRLVSFWSFDEDRTRLSAYVAARLADPPVPETEAPLVPLVPLEPAGNVPTARAIPLTRRETAVFLTPVPTEPPKLRPIFRAIHFSNSALAARLGVAGERPEEGRAEARLPQASPSFVPPLLSGGRPARYHPRLAPGAGVADPRAVDPDLLHAMRRALERNLLAALLAELPGARQLRAKGMIPLQLVLAPASVASSAFARLVELALAHGIRLAVAFAFAEALAEPGPFARAVALLQAAGLGFALRAIAVPTLLLARPEALGADLIVLDWLDGLADVSGAEKRALSVRLAEIGVARIVLGNARSEHAVLWGLARGIRRFQGSYVEEMLAVAQRTRACDAPLAPARAVVAA